MVPGGRNFIVGCSDGDVFAFQAKVNRAAAAAAVLQRYRAPPQRRRYIPFGMDDTERTTRGGQGFEESR